MSLTAKQEMFCREYLKDLNATQAAIRAGYSEKSAKSQGQRLLTNDDISSFIEKLKVKRESVVDIDANWVLEQAKKSFQFNSQEVFDSEGNPKMVNATAASKFLELCGKHVSVKAFDKDQQQAEHKPVEVIIRRAVKDA